MLKKFFLLLFRMFRGKVFLIFFIIFLTSFGFLGADTLVKNAQKTVQDISRNIALSDIVISGRDRFNAEQKNEILSILDKYGAKFAEDISIDTTLEGNDTNIFIAEVSFVSENYPLYSENEFPSFGESSVIVSPNLQAQISDSIMLGKSSFFVQGTYEDTGANSLSFFTEGRKIFAPISVLDQTELISTGSRSDYHFYVGANQQIIGSLYDELSIYIGSNKEYRIRLSKERESRVGRIMDDFSQYVYIFFLFIIIISILGLLLTIESFVTISKKNFALLHILGLPTKKVVLYLIFFLLILFHIAFILSSLLVYYGVVLLTNVDSFQGFSFQWISLLDTYFVSLSVLIFGSLYSLIQFISFNPIKNLKPQNSVLGKREVLYQGGIVLLGVFVLSFFFTFSFIFSLGLAFGSLLLIYLLFIFIKGILLILFGQVSKYKSTLFLLFDSFRFTVRPGNISYLVVIPLLLCFSLFFTFTLVSISLIKTITLNESDTNVFVLNVRSGDIKEVSNMFDSPEIFDIILGRIVTINNQKLTDFFQTSEVSGEFTREFNFTTSDLKNNKVIRGDMLSKGGVSIDDDFAQRLGVDVGDTIRFLISGKEIMFTIMNVRESIRDSFSPFFYFQFLPEEFEGLDRNYFVSDFYEGDISILQKNLYGVGQHLTVVNLDLILKQVKEIAGKVFAFSSVLFAYLLVFVFLLLISTFGFIGNLRDSAMKLYHVLGANDRVIKYHVFFEYTILVSVSLLLSIIVGSGFDLILFQFIFLDFNILYYLYSFLMLLGLYFTIIIFIWFIGKKRSKM